MSFVGVGRDHAGSNIETLSYSKISNNKSSALISPQPPTSSPPFIASLSDPMFYVPKLMFLTKGKGVHKDHLTSFELALRDADIADLNLVSVSSIIPPQCKIIQDKKEESI
jgi:hypothetical protein